MRSQKQKNKDWGLSYGQLVWREFTKSRVNVVFLIFIIFLFAVAIFAPFIANNKPFVICTKGRLHLPLFTNLQASDYSILLAAIVGVIQLLLVRRNAFKIDPTIRGTVFWRQMIRSFSIVCIGAILIFIFIPRKINAADYKEMISSGQASWAVFPPVRFGYGQTDLENRRQPPSREHWLGTDDVGSDVLSRLIYGSRVSLSVGFVAVGISSVIGVVVGAILGYFGGRVDFIGMRIVEIMRAIPAFFLIITIVAFFPRSLFNIMLIIGITSWTQNARFVRAEFLRLRNQDFVLAAKSLGLPLRSILFKHMLPNGITPVLVNAAFGVSAAIFIEAALSFLGFGVAPPTPSWGQMLSLAIGAGGKFHWWISLFPGLAIFLTVMAYNLVGEGFRDALDPRSRSSV